MLCDKMYYAATVFDCCNTFATNGNTEYLRVCDEIYECSKVATPGNTICDDDDNDEPSLHQFICLHAVGMIRQPLSLAA